MRVAFYRSDEGGYDDKFIDKFSGNIGYSHCEIVVSSVEGISAHMQTGGVASFYYPDLLNSKYWDVYEIDIPYSAKAMGEARDMIGTKYDFLGVGAKFINIDLHNNYKVWCSEFTLMVINKAIEDFNENTAVVPISLIEDERVMPNEAFELLKKKFTIKLVSENTSLQATYNSKAKNTDRWGRIIKDDTPKENWFWRMFK